MTSKADLDRAVAEIKSAVGYVNVVVANSGITGPAPPVNMPSSSSSSSSNPSISQYRDVLWGWDTEGLTNTYRVNTVGVFNTVTAFLELLYEGNKRGNLKQRSQVIATASIGAFNRSPFVGFSYGTSKAAVVHMMKQFSTSLGQFDIRANVLAPGC